MARQIRGGIVYYTSDLLDQPAIRHGFFSRLGGVSPTPFDSLNVKRDLGDPVTNVLENRKRICHSLDLDSRQLVFAYLAHDNKVLLVDNAMAGREMNGFDALITTVRNLPISLSTADCVPIILADTPRQIVAIVHASWRSIIAGVISQTIKQIQALGINPSDIVAALGPAIAVENYEVKADVIEVVKHKLPFYDQVLAQKGSKTFFDLRKASDFQLREAGIKQIDHLVIDTFTRTDEFYSYRKAGRTGRFATVASL